MAKRKSNKSKRPSTKASARIKKSTRDRLAKEAANTRSRIAAFKKKDYSSSYDVPEASDYLLANLLLRIDAGEKPSSILKEMKNITADKIINQPKPFITTSGYSIKPAEYKKLQLAIKTANKNIREARSIYSDFADVLPDEFSLHDVASQVTNLQGIKNKISDVSVFTPENLIPQAVNSSGETGTIAEVEYYKRILERENKRREQLREETAPGKVEGFFLMQGDAERKEIPVNDITSLSELKRRAETWDDPARLYRANLFLANYEKSLDRFETILRTGFYMNDTIEERFEYIRNVIAQLYNNEKAISYISSRMPNIDIGLISGALYGDVNFDEVYNAWIDAEEMFL